MKNSKKYNILFATNVILLIIGAILLIISIVFVGMNMLERYSGFADTSEGNKEPADGFTIESMNIELYVNEDNSVDVLEYITVYFYEGGHHGIYVLVPSWLKYTGKDNKTISRKANISKLKAIGEEYSLETVNGKQKLKIGNPNKTLSEGIHEYTIGYTYDMGEDPFENFDEFIFHCFGDYWGTEIHNASVKVIFPKEVNFENNVHFFSDKYRTNDITNRVNYTYTENTLEAKVDSRFALNSALTVDVELPEGYFEVQEDTTPVYGNKSFTICCIVIASGIISFILWLIKGKDHSKDLYPETVEFYPPNGMDAAQIGYINKSSGGNKLGVALIVELASKGFINIFDNEGTIKIDKATDYNQAQQMTANEKIIYDALFATDSTTILKENKHLYDAFLAVENNVRSELSGLINDISSQVVRLFPNLAAIINTIIWCNAFCFIKDMDPKYKILYLIAFAANVLTFLFAILMGRKNHYGEKLSAQVRGFKNYLELVEKKQLEEQVQLNPNYYYDILPYAYVLDISKTWIEKFENIPMPENSSISTYNWHSRDSLDRMGSSIYTSSGSSSSGGCSSCGGGCSSCGGGGSW